MSLSVSAYVYRCFVVHLPASVSAFILCLSVFVSASTLCLCLCVGIQAQHAWSALESQSEQLHCSSSDAHDMMVCSLYVQCSGPNARCMLHYKLTSSGPDVVSAAFACLVPPDADVTVDVFPDAEAAAPGLQAPNQGVPHVASSMPSNSASGYDQVGIIHSCGQ